MVLEAMEFSRIQDATMFLNDGRNLVMSDGGMDYDLVPLQSSERLLILDDHGVLREAFTDVSYLLSHNLPAYVDDTEIPPHVLDHMYAKKPREPGSELTPSKPRRRAKRKEQIVEQFIIPDSQPPAPKINIIRQRLPSTTVYKSLSARPKILHGGGSSKKNSPGISNPPTIPVKGKTSPSKQNTHTGRGKIKEDPSKTMYASFDDVNKLFNSRTLLGSPNKYGKDHGGGGSKLSKSNSSKNVPNSNTIIMDDLQRDGAAYDDEMLFDFGIAEDDEAITCTLGTEGFSDGEFDEFSMDNVYNNSNQSSLNPPSGPPSGLSPKSPSGMLLNQRPQLETSQLPPEISDDDDSNQIMVSIHNRKPSQDWDTVQLFEQAIKHESDLSQSSSDLLGPPMIKVEITSSPSCAHAKNIGLIQPKAEILQDPQHELHAEEVKDMNFFFEQKPAVADFSKDSSSSQNSFTAANQCSPTRRSSRVVKTPAWLVDSDKIPFAKRQRKKSST